MKAKAKKKKTAAQLSAIAHKAVATRRKRIEEREAEEAKKRQVRHNAAVKAWETRRAKS